MLNFLPYLTINVSCISSRLYFSMYLCWNVWNFQGFMLAYDICKLSVNFVFFAFLFQLFPIKKTLPSLHFRRLHTYHQLNLFYRLCKICPSCRICIRETCRMRSSLMMMTMTFPVHLLFVVPHKKLSKVL